MAKCDDLDFEDTLSEYIRRIEQAEENANLGVDLPIITSKDLPVDLPPNAQSENVKRKQIGWRLYQNPMFYIVRVKKGTKVRQHSHKEDVFRYIIRGSLDVHVKESEKEGSSEISRTIGAGEWVVVRANHSYRIEAGPGKDEDDDDNNDNNDDNVEDNDKRHGYVALVAYQMACKPK
jgi:quercetin dioxygenase-like cupin family protein